MTNSEWKVLVPVKILEGETVPDAVIEALATLPVVVLGYHVVPEQTAPGQARMQFEDKAQSKLDDLAAAFTEAGGASETRLVFTHDEEQTLDRVADETGCDAILIPNPTAQVERLLVPLRGDVNIARITSFVAALINDRNLRITLYHVAESEKMTPAGQSMVDEAEAQFRDFGISSDAISKEVVVSGTPIKSIGTAATDHDAVVMGESHPSLRSFLFGDASDRVAVESLGPVIVVRRVRNSDVSE